MSDGIDLHNIYDLRSNFIIIGLTGKTNSGYSEVSKQLVDGFDRSAFSTPNDLFALAGGKFRSNSFRKHRIVYEFAVHNFKPFFEIKYKNVITLFLLKYTIRELISFLESTNLLAVLKNSLNINHNFDYEVRSLASISTLFDHYSKVFSAVDNQKTLTKKRENLFKLFYNEEFDDFSTQLHTLLGKNSDINAGRKNGSIIYHKTVQIICDNIRKSGIPYDFASSSSINVFSIAELINELILGYEGGNSARITHLVINSLKNPFEILYFKHRYSGFYCFAINKNEDIYEADIIGKFTMTTERKSVLKVMEEEYKGGSEKEFYKQNVRACLQLADVYINFISKADVTKHNNFSLSSYETIKTTPYFTWYDQLLKYVCLIYHPGLVSPSSEERCMQLAFTAKYNSGCISRQVGAAITDNNFSIKAVGWNDTPEGQVPCALRNLHDLINGEYDNLVAFSNYERQAIDEEFKEKIEDNFVNKLEPNKEILHGRNICYCFKSIMNSVSEGKNQVHTRSLHAEENAFLQLSKYGSEGIKNGYLFSTASPCELCSKKAYQLGIKVIYYIEPYPSISVPHILTSGSNPIEIRLFSGAIGSAYHRLYHPIMNYKDELSLLLNQNIIDLTKQLKSENEFLKAKIKELERIQKSDAK